jgi:hypothetical protein
MAAERLHETIEVHVTELQQLFNAIDPSPFRERDLDPNAEEFIIGWAREMPRDTDLELAVYVDRLADVAADTETLRTAVREFFAYRSRTARQHLSLTFRIGRISLAIGLACLAALLGLGDLIANALSGRRVGELLRESLVIGGWVAMWRPLEVFLYDWWPIRSDARLFQRLSTMPVRIVEHVH